MDALRNLANRAKRLDSNVILATIYKESEVEGFIVSLNTEGQPTSQLYEFGIDSKGNLLEPPYSFTTIQLKLDGFGDKRIDHVTLKDTGEFYESFQIEILKDGFEIVANPLKENTDLTEKYGQDIIGLTDENKAILSEYLQPFIFAELRKNLLE